MLYRLIKLSLPLSISLTGKSPVLFLLRVIVPVRGDITFWPARLYLRRCFGEFKLLNSHFSNWNDQLFPSPGAPLCSSEVSFCRHPSYLKHSGVLRCGNIWGIWVIGRSLPLDRCSQITCWGGGEDRLLRWGYYAVSVALKRRARWLMGWCQSSKQMARDASCQKEWEVLGFLGNSRVPTWM